MAAKLTVTNNLKQNIHVMAAERPGFLLVDLLTDAAMLADAANDLRLALKAGMELPALVADVATLLKCARATRQIANSGVEAVTAMETAAERLWDKLMNNTVIVPPGESLDVLTETALTEFCTPAGLLGLLHASTLSMTIATEDKSRQIIIQTDIPETWTVSEVGARSGSAVQRDWDGEASSDSRMAMAASGDEVWIAWRDKDSNIWTCRQAYGFWETPIKAPMQSAAGPGMAFHEGVLYLLARGQGSDTALSYTTYGPDGWAVPKSANGSTTHSPACCSFEDRLVMVARQDNDAVMLSSFSTSVGSWEAQEQVPNIGSANGPAIAVYNNALYMVWRGSGPDQDLWYTSSKIGYIASSWLPQSHISSGSSGAPCLATFKGHLQCCWRGVNDNLSLWFSAFDGTVWAPQNTAPYAQSDVGPAMVALPDGSMIMLAWTGHDNDDTLYWAPVYDETFNIYPSYHLPMYV